MFDDLRQEVEEKNAIEKTDIKKAQFQIKELQAQLQECEKRCDHFQKEH